MTILITGGTGFIGKALIRHLVESGYQVRTLIRPSPKSPNLPLGVPVDVAVSSLSDERGLRAAMAGIETVYHLAGGEWHGPRASLMDIDIQGTRSVVRAAEDAGVNRLFFLSHLGADRASAFPVLKAKAIAEEFIRRSKLDYTILRSAIVFGPNDGLTNGLARILGVIPFFFFVPGDGRVLLQPLWVEDLVTCLTWSLDEEATRKGTFDIGGPEYLSFKQIVNLVMEETGIHRLLVGVYPPYLRIGTVLLESMFPNLPVSVYWLDYMAVNRTTAIDTIPRIFKLMPAKMSQRLEYLHDVDWRISLIQALRTRRR
jgi:uncharacterized protein YbjT (DUF2867 family)